MTKMIKEYSFKKDSLDLSDFMYAYSPRTNVFKQFIEEDESVCNAYNDDIKEFDYISVVTKERFTSGTEFSTVCSFDRFGAPLLVFSDDIHPDKEGILRYDLHFEVVAYEDGINVWHIIHWPERVECPQKATLIATTSFKIAACDEIVINVRVEGKKLLINVNGHELTAEHDEFPESFHAGFTACEGVNHFKSFTIKN